VNILFVFCVCTSCPVCCSCCIRREKQRNIWLFNGYRLKFLRRGERGWLTGGITTGILLFSTTTNVERRISITVLWKCKYLSDSLSCSFLTCFSFLKGKKYTFGSPSYLTLYVPLVSFWTNEQFFVKSSIGKHPSDIIVNFLQLIITTLWKYALVRRKWH
jgi:hypothetical protein